MRIIDSLFDIDDSMKNCCLTLGNFDGFHLGHRKIIDTVRKTAERLSTKTAVMTFEPHPAVILHPEKKPQVLTPLFLKAQLIEEAGIDFLIVVKDSYKMLTLSPADFVKEFLMEHLSPQAIVEGDDFHFGYGRSGTVETLASFGETFGFEIVVVPPVTDQSDSKVSSTIVRRLLQKGSVASASNTLGRNYRLMGQVISGRGKGAELGFPTANIDPYEQTIPAEGVYAGYVAINNNLKNLCANTANISAIFSLGRAKTFISDHPMLIEAHIFDNGVDDLYGKYLSMDFVEHIRGQERFESEELLKKQIKIDCDKAKKILAKEINL
ncbi:MAG: bifunctional riboflavin kinase/FAD synthetase [Anaerohalosphaeraceae bacterium]|nr:bifunctional riboflavin kinase/FAD synthetase [Anaerohalosphaeraceae bacterium]